MMNKIFEIIDIPVPSNGSDGKYVGLAIIRYNRR